MLTPQLTGTGARGAEGTNYGHENSEVMDSVGVHVELTVRHCFLRGDVLRRTMEQTCPVHASR